MVVFYCLLGFVVLESLIWAESNLVLIEGKTWGPELLSRVEE